MLFQSGMTGLSGRGALTIRVGFIFSLIGLQRILFTNIFQRLQKPGNGLKAFAKGSG